MSPGLIYFVTGNLFLVTPFTYFTNLLLPTSVNLPSVLVIPRYLFSGCSRHYNGQSYIFYLEIIW